LEIYNLFYSLEKIFRNKKKKTFQFITNAIDKMKNKTIAGVIREL